MIEELKWRQRAKEKDFKEGDGNTKKKSTEGYWEEEEEPYLNSD
jgi:hypothetical protein